MNSFDHQAGPVSPPEMQPGKPEISMAPLIDVVFLLLIFFMVTTVFPENRGLVVEQPESKFSQPISAKELTFLITDKGKIFFSNHPITADDVERLVREKLNTAPDSAVLLQVDRRATTQTLIKVMDACKLGGARQVGIATNEAKHTT